MTTLAYITLSLVLGLVLRSALERLMRKAGTALPDPTPQPPDEPAPSVCRRLHNEAKLVAMGSFGYAAIFLDSLDDTAAWRIFRHLEDEHRHFLAHELLNLPEISPQLRRHVLEDMAEGFEVSPAEMQQMMVAKPDLGARMLISLLPMTMGEIAELQEAPHELPHQWGKSKGEVESVVQPSVIDMLSWLRRGPLLDEEEEH